MSSMHVMISARFKSDVHEDNVRELANLLREQERINVFIVEAKPGQGFGEQTAFGLSNMAVMIAYATSNYGEKTGSPYCSYYEVKRCVDRGIFVMPIKLCPEWPPHPPGDGGQGAWMNEMLFTPDKVFLEWSNKQWDAAACAKEIAQNLRDLAKTEASISNDIFLAETSASETAAAASGASAAASGVEAFMDLKDAIANAQFKSDPSISGAATAEGGATAKESRLSWLRSKVANIDKSLIQQQEEAEELGKGGQATVELAEYRKQKVAVKVYGLDKKDDAAQERAYTEALLLGIISKLPVGPHHIVQFFGVSCTTVSRFVEIGLVLELAPQGSLDVILHGKDVPSFWNGSQDAWWKEREDYVKERGLGWTGGIANALQFLHQDLQIVHCDIKPANILLFDDAKTPKLTDFGSCYLAPDPVSQWQFTRSVATKNSVGFTDRYKAPERIADETNLSSKADMWSMGLIAYEIAHGTKVWNDLREDELSGQGTRNVMALMAQTTAWKPGTLQTLLNVIKQCLFLEASARASADEIANMLRHPRPNRGSGLEDVANLALVEEEQTGADIANEPKQAEQESKRMGEESPLETSLERPSEQVQVRGTCSVCAQPVTNQQPRRRNEDGTYWHEHCVQQGAFAVESTMAGLPPSPKFFGLETWEALAGGPLEQRLGALYTMLAVNKPQHEIQDLARKFEGKEAILNGKLREKYAVDLQSSKQDLAVAARRCQALAELMERLKIKDVNWTDLSAPLPGDEYWGNPPLLECAKHDEPQLAQMLIDAGAPINAINPKDGASALSLAAQHGHVEVVGRLIAAKCKLDLQDTDGRSALYTAAGNGHVEVVGRLIAAKCKLDLQSKIGASALSVAAQNGHVEVVGRLIAAKCKLDLQDKYGSSALMLAAGNGHVEVVGRLIAAKCKLDLRNSQGGTALYWARQQGHTGVVNALIRAGARQSSASHPVQYAADPMQQQYGQGGVQFGSPYGWPGRG